jgi:hypothetical protein
VTRVQDIRSASKTNVDWGKWESGKMPRAFFPLSLPRNRSFRLGSRYRWRVIQFQALENTFRVLVAFHIDKEQYRATLALERGRDLSVIASYEFHGTHPGWHLLAACGDVESVPVGMMRGPWQRRFPNARQYHRQTEFGVDSERKA